MPFQCETMGQGHVRHHDSMGRRPERRISLDKLCKVLGIDSPKGEMDGSKVGDYFRAGRIAEIAAYCRADVAAVRQVHRRMIFA